MTPPRTKSRGPGGHSCRAGVRPGVRMALVGGLGRYRRGNIAAGLRRSARPKPHPAWRLDRARLEHMLHLTAEMRERATANEHWPTIFQLHAHA